MNAEPPPFGDPSNIQRENAAAVKKGVAVGCGGCFILVALLVGAGALVSFTVLMFIRNSEVAVESLRRARSSSELVQYLGEPVEMGWLLTGSVQTSNQSGNAEMTIPLSGPRGTATLRSRAVKKEGGPWEFDQMEARLPSGTVLNLLEPGPEHP